MPFQMRLPVTFAKAGRARGSRRDRADEQGRAHASTRFSASGTPAEFDGKVSRGGRYILVDDHVGLGGTLANLKGYLETRGALVEGITTLTESRDARKISLSLDTLPPLHRATVATKLQHVFRRIVVHR